MLIKLTAAVGALLTVLGGVSTYIADTRPYQVTGHFLSAEGVVPGNDVLSSGAKVGSVSAVALATLLRRVLFGSPNPDAPGVSDASLGETWFLGLLAGALLWVGIFPGGPKIPGTEFPLFDPGLLNQMTAGISDLASPYTPPTPGGVTQ